MQTKIALVCFDFPPNEGIGGRRWAKFAKALAKKGHEIHVLKAEPKNNRIHSPWASDVKSERIKVYEMKRSYPKILSNSGNGTLDKIRFRITRSKMRRKYLGTIYDDSLGMEKQFVELLKKVVTENDIQNVIVTGAPFNLLYLAAHVKKEFSHLNLIGDYRDPWIDAPNYGMSHLKAERREQEIRKQQFVFENFDHIIFPSEALRENLYAHAKNLDQLSCKFSVLTHFYDLDEYDATVLNAHGVKKLKWVYGGVLYQGLDPYLKILKEGLDLMKREDMKLYKRFEVKFFTHQKNRLLSFSEHQDVVKTSEPIGTELHQELKTSEGILILLAPHNKDFQTTKFMESLPHGKPFIYFGPEGETAKFIRSNSLGHVISKPEDVSTILQAISDGSDNYNFDFDIQPFSLTSVCEELELLFKS